MEVPVDKSAISVNLVPLPYNRVAVQHVDFGLNGAALRSFLRGKETWHETDYVVFRRGDDCAVVEVQKTDRQDLFCRITEVGMVSLPDKTRWVDDFTVDSGNPSALAEKARALGVADSETLVVNGLYEHVDFIHRPQPAVIEVFDLWPPEPPRLLHMARRVLANRSFPAVVLNPHIQSIPALVRDRGNRAILFPCGVSQLKTLGEAFYLDERPARRDWVLVGCERSRQVHHHVYGDDPLRIELCPKVLFAVNAGLVLMRCCMVEKSFELCGGVAIVPWGADLPLVEDAIRALLDLRPPTW